ncbi:MAG TPA: sulfur carrier protein ThiS [Modestobacter sp.]|jgi:sulfur carrier protein|nr:sulfur carrier protein ThiS [Modestobacter sp.]
MSIRVTVNGDPTDLAEGATVAVLVAERSSGHDRVAVALNGDVVPRSRWTATELSPGDRLEVLAPTAGG